MACIILILFHVDIIEHKIIMRTMLVFVFFVCSKLDWHLTTLDTALSYWVTLVSNMLCQAEIFSL